eukprot:jgi/Chlat1/5856/Chrsp4S06236
MGVAVFTGYLLIGIGPGLALFFVGLAKKSYYVLVTLTSCFFWLLALLLASLLRPLLLSSSRASGIFAYTTLVVLSVALLECSRLLLWLLTRRMQAKLDEVAAHKGSLPMSEGEKLTTALAGGLGQGFAHSAIFFVAILTPSLGPGTFYLDACPQMPYFLAAGNTVAAFDAFSCGNKRRIGGVAGLHFAAALLCLLNLAPSGCLASIPLVFACASAASVMACSTCLQRLQYTRVHGSDGPEDERTSSD